MFSFQKSKTSLFLVFLVIIGLFLRLWNIERVPSRLTVDEMSIGYNAYSILKTGKDEWGVFLPKAFQAFGDYKQPVYIYLTVPFIALFDLTATAVRLPSVWAGVALIGLTYVLVKKNFGELPALFSAFVVTFSPWAIQLSRMGFESNVALALFVAGLISLQLAREQNSWKWGIATGILLALTCYAYVAFRLTIVLMMLGLAFFSYKQKTWKKSWLISVITLVIVLLPLGKELISGSGTARFSQVSLFSDKGIAAQELERRNFCFLVNQAILPKVCQIFFTQELFLVSRFAQNYVSFFSFNFLFWEGDDSLYLNPVGFGEFWLILLPVFVLGVIYFFKLSKKTDRWWQFIFLFTPIPSALVSSPQIVRGSAVMFFLSIMIGVGLWRVWEMIKNHAYKVPIVVSSCVLLLLSGIYSQLNYHVVYANQHADAFSPFPPELSDAVAQHEAQYQTIYFSNQYFSDAHIFLAFYQKIDPAEYQRTVIRPTPDQFGFSHPIQLGKYYFGEKTLQEFVCSEEEKVLFIGNNQEVKPEQTLQTLYDFSHVHPQVKMIDIDQQREVQKQSKNFEIICAQ